MSADIDLEIRVDTVGFLANNLRGYEPTSILREQLQNADDACHQQGKDGELILQFLPDRLRVMNPSVFADRDWQRIMTPSSRGKFGDENQTGEFGIGFWGCLHLTDVPVVISNGRRVELDIAKPRATAVDAVEGTVFEFVYRREMTALARELDALPVTPAVENEMVRIFVDQLADLLLFTRAIDRIRLELPDGSIRTASRTTEPVSGQVDRLTVEVEGDPSKTCRFLVVKGQVPSPPEGRHDRVSVALPLTKSHMGPGRAFFTFPTETSTGLNLSIDAHYRATDDRRSLENSGEHGAWNDAIFQAAGEAVAGQLETILDPKVHELPYEEALTWFSLAPSALPEVEFRAREFSRSVDRAARHARVALDTAGKLRAPVDLVSLPPVIEELLSEAIDHPVAAPLQMPQAIEVLRRWGLTTWGPREVAGWLARFVPSGPFRRAEGPELLRPKGNAKRLLDYCADQLLQLRGVPLALGTDDVFHPIGGDLRRRNPELGDLEDGLEHPLLVADLEGTIAGTLARPADATWLHDAIEASAHKLLGRKVGSRSVGVAKSQTNVLRAIQVLVSHDLSLDGLPLAADETLELGPFDTRTVSGLPSGPARAAAEAVARRLGFRPLHKSIDDEAVRPSTIAFGISLLVEEIPKVVDWDPVADSRLLLEIITAVRLEGAVIAPKQVEDLRSLPIWMANDGAPHALTELRLPARDRVVRSQRLLVSEELVGAVDPSDPGYATLNSVLQVQVLDTTEETVISCENPPKGRTALRELLEELADCERLSPPQLARLRSSHFVLCQDGTVRRPTDVLLCGDRLPLSLNGVRVDAKVISDRRVRKRLTELGAPDLPSAPQLLDIAAEVAKAPLVVDPEPEREPEPGRILWNFLLRHADKYQRGTIGELADIAWLGATPGPLRCKPSKCLDPSLVFAEMLYPVVAGVASPPLELREGLRIRASLEPEDYVKLAHTSASQGQALPKRYFTRLNEQAGRGGQSAVLIGGLRTVAFIPVLDGFVRPDEMVSSRQGEVWGHRRNVVPPLLDEFPALLTAWGIGEDAVVGWQDHLEVLKEIGGLDSPSDEDLRLARMRFRSIAELVTEEAQLETFRRHGWIPTSVGLRPCGDTYLGDLPVTLMERLAALLPIAHIDEEVGPFIEALGLASLRRSVDIEPVIENPTTDRTWRGRLTVQALNIMRFLKHAGLDVGQSFRDTWPPTVCKVSRLDLRASLQGVHLDEWEADAYLGDQDGEPVLFVRGASTDVRAVVDAIDSALGIEAGRKSLLLSILESETPENAAQRLDWERIPPLAAEEEYVFEASSLDVSIIDEPEPANPGAPGSEAEAELEPHLEPELEPDSEAEPNWEGEVADDGPGSAAFDDTAEPHEQEQPSAHAPTAGLDDAEHEADGPPAGPERAQSPRGVTDFDELEDLGIVVVRDLDEDRADADYDPEPEPGEERQLDKVRAVLSFYDVSEGLIPIQANKLGWLASNAPLQTVAIFGKVVNAARYGQGHIRIEGGPDLFHQRHVVPGTVVWLHPSVPGRIEVEIRPEPHAIDGVWMLELADDGSLTRLELQDVELIWETDDAFYRAERRLEDIEALMADGGKSAVHLIIDAFELHPGEGFTVDEIWGIVAASRLFSKSTIQWTLSAQTGLFENIDGRWYMTGNTLRLSRSGWSRASDYGGGRGGSAGASPQGGAGRPPASDQRGAVDHLKEARKLAKKLAVHLTELTPTQLSSISQILGLDAIERDEAFAATCRSYLDAGGSDMLEAIERDLQGDPGRALVLVTVLEEVASGVVASRRELVDLVVRIGPAEAVRRAQLLALRIEVVAAGPTSDPALGARELMNAGTLDEVTLPLVWERIGQMWTERRSGDPLEQASDWSAALAEWETLDRRAARFGEAPPMAVRARQSAIGWINAQLPAEVYDDRERQELRVLVDLLFPQSHELVLDGLHQLGLLAAQAPQSEDVALSHYRLVVAYAKVAGISTGVVGRSRREIQRLEKEGHAARLTSFIESWCDLTRTPIASISGE